MSYWKSDKACGMDLSLVDRATQTEFSQRSMETQTMAAGSSGSSDCPECGPLGGDGGETGEFGKVELLAGFAVCLGGHFKPIPVKIYNAYDSKAYTYGILNHAAQKSIHGSSVPGDGFSPDEYGYESVYARTIERIEHGLSGFESEASHVLRLRSINSAVVVVKVLPDGIDSEELLETL